MCSISKNLRENSWEPAPCKQVRFLQFPSSIDSTAMVQSLQFMAPTPAYSYSPMKSKTPVLNTILRGSRYFQKLSSSYKISWSSWALSLPCSQSSSQSEVGLSNTSSTPNPIETTTCCPSIVQSSPKQVQRAPWPGTLPCIHTTSNIPYLLS